MVDNITLKIMNDTAQSLKSVLKNQSNSSKLEEKKIYERMVKRMDKMDNYMETAQYQNRMDKFKFVAGVALYTTFVYILGRWPFDFFYKFYVVLSMISYLFRWEQFKKKNWHYYF